MIYIKTLYLILGNGFSIDLINKLDKNTEIDLNNLFSKGTNVEFPKSEENGFLSMKHCPNLWMLGARTTMTNSESYSLINNIITCANVYNLSFKNNVHKNDNHETSNYIKAYNELTYYIRYLFIYYNSIVSDEELKNILPSINLINYIIDKYDEYDKIVIVTYNYDIWLERLLTQKGLKFDIAGFEDLDAKIKIFKPHGSISFSFNTKSSETSPFKIRYDMYDDITQNVEDFSVKYDLKNDFPIINAIIPPAGDAGRRDLGWISQIRNGLTGVLESSTTDDDVIIFGVSYWHVDRNELDDIFIRLANNVNIKYINPRPASELDAVLTSLFSNYIHYCNDKMIGGKSNE